MKISIIYYSKTGTHQKKWAKRLPQESVQKAGKQGFFPLKNLWMQSISLPATGVIFGTPTYLASTCWQMKKWFDVDSAGISLAGKLGGVYSTAHFAQGGGDIAVMTLIGHMLVKGMLIYSGGSSLGKPYIHLGPVALDAVEGHYENSRETFRIFGKRFADKAGEIFHK